MSWLGRVAEAGMSMSEKAMNSYLRQSLASAASKSGKLNQNKVHGIVAELAFRTHLEKLGFGNRVSVGGWIARTVGEGQFGLHTVALFPEVGLPSEIFRVGRVPQSTPQRLHSI